MILFLLARTASAVTSATPPRPRPRGEERKHANARPSETKQCSVPAPSPVKFLRAKSIALFTAETGVRVLLGAPIKSSRIFVIPRRMPLGAQYCPISAPYRTCFTEDKSGG